jgi:thioredoxin-related protein
MTIVLIRRSVLLTCLLCLIILSVSSTDLFGQSVAPQDSVHWVGVDTGFAMAKETGKPVFLWFYGSWCGYCKKMLAKVFPDSFVIATLNASFIPIKIETASKRQITYQGISMTESEFAINEFNARSVPSTWFVEPNGCRILHLIGYRPVSDLAKNLDYVRTKQYGECQNVSLIDPPKMAKPRTDSTKTSVVQDTTKK